MNRAETVREAYELLVEATGLIQRANELLEVRSATPDSTAPVEAIIAWASALLDVRPTGEVGA